MRCWLVAGAWLATALAGSPAYAEEGALPFQRLVLSGHAVRWVAARVDGPLTVSYALADSETENTRAINCRHMRAPNDLLHNSALSRDDFKLALRRAFDRWQRVADIAFVEAAPGDRAQIVIGEQVEPQGFAYADLTLAAGGGGDPAAILAARICLNPQRTWKIGFDGNLSIYDLEYTLAHEIGHAIGLDHSGPRGHLMSFTYAESSLDLTSGDAAGAVAIYGPVRSRGEDLAEKAGEAHTGAALSTELVAPLSRGLANPLSQQ